MKLNKSEKLKLVKEHLEGITLREISEKYNYDISHIKYNVQLYLKYGEKVFDESNEIKTYSREQKLEIVKRYLNGNESYRQIGIELGLSDSSTIRDWVRLYKEKGEDGLQTSHSRKAYLLQEDRLNQIANQELLDKLKYLESENEYLKKSYSLILERNKQPKKK